jgi:hypothetical protein
MQFNTAKRFVYFFENAAPYKKRIFFLSAIVIYFGKKFLYEKINLFCCRYYNLYFHFQPAKATKVIPVRKALPVLPAQQVLPVPRVLQGLQVQIQLFMVTGRILLLLHEALSVRFL